MTIQEIKERVEKIRASAGDDESAHGQEDQLRADFIAFVAEGSDELARMAKLVLSTDDIGFARWCA